MRGQAAVAQVVLNRVRNPAYPDTICSVVYQNNGWFNRCQFSFACDRIKDRINSPWHYRRAQDRPAHLLPHLWRRLELTIPCACRPAEQAGSARHAASAPAQIAGQYVAPS